MTWDENGHMVPITDEHRRRWAESLIPPAPPDGPRLKKEKRQFHLEPPYDVPFFVDPNGIFIGLTMSIPFVVTGLIITYWYFAVSAGLLVFAVYQTVRHRRVRK
jgi:hypothetical protein